MPSPEEAAQPVVHVERTDDPAVMRWVCSEPSLVAVVSGRRQVPAESTLAGLVVTVAEGSVWVRIDEAAAWPELAPAVHESVVDALRTRADWLFVVPPESASPLREPAVASVQQVVDRAAGAIAGAHGGGITVRSVANGTVTVELSGACHGCRLSQDTLRRVVAPAVHRAFPGLEVAAE